MKKISKILEMNYFQNTMKKMIYFLNIKKLIKSRNNNKHLNYKIIIITIKNT